MLPLLCCNFLFSYDLYCVSLPFIDYVGSRGATLQPEVVPAIVFAFIHLTKNTSILISVWSLHPATVTERAIPFEVAEVLYLYKTISLDLQSTSELG